MRQVLPRSFADTKKLTNEQITQLRKKPFYFEVEDDCFIEVVAWTQYPSYDLIYGKPTPESARYHRETAAMCVRYADGRTYCTYLDEQELLDTIDALVMIYNMRTKRV